MELEMDCLTSICTKVCASSRLVSQGHMCDDGWAKYKENVPYVSDPNQNVETTYNSKLNFT